MSNDNNKNDYFIVSEGYDMKDIDIEAMIPPVEVNSLSDLEKVFDSGLYQTQDSKSSKDQNEAFVRFDNIDIHFKNLYKVSFVNLVSNDSSESESYSQKIKMFSLEGYLEPGVFLDTALFMTEEIDNSRLLRFLTVQYGNNENKQQVLRFSYIAEFELCDSQLKISFVLS